MPNPEVRNEPSSAAEILASTADHLKKLQMEIDPKKTKGEMPAKEELARYRTEIAELRATNALKPDQENILKAFEAWFEVLENNSEGIRRFSSALEKLESYTLLLVNRPATETWKTEPVMYNLNLAFERLTTEEKRYVIENLLKEANTRIQSTGFQVNLVGSDLSIQEISPKGKTTNLPKNEYQNMAKEWMKNAGDKLSIVKQFGTWMLKMFASILSDKNFLKKLILSDKIAYSREAEMAYLRSFPALEKLDDGTLGHARDLLHAKAAEIAQYRGKAFDITSLMDELTKDNKSNVTSPAVLESDATAFAAKEKGEWLKKQPQPQVAAAVPPATPAPAATPAPVTPAPVTAKS